MYTHVQTVKYQLHNFGYFTCEVNVLIFAFEPGIAQYKDEW